MESVDITKQLTDIPLTEQEKDPDLSNAIKLFRERMKGDDIQELKSRRLWMINSTATGGGVAEMLPRIIYALRAFDLDVEWMVITANEEPEFFSITKKIHNFLHGLNPAKV